MAKYRIGYLLLVIGAGVFAGAYNSKLTFVLFIAALLLPVATFLLLVCERLALKLEVSPARVFSQKLQQFAVTVTVRNRFLIPVSPMRLTGVFPDGDGNLVADKTMIVSVMPFRKSEFIFNGCLKYRGEYRLGLSEAVIYDLLGIFHFRIRLTPGVRAVIAPRRLTVDQSNALCSDDHDSARTQMSFFENNSFSAVREYVEGEPLRHVHWKLSAKQDKLMIKQMEQNLGTNALVITDTASRLADEGDRVRAVDAAIEVSLAVTGKIIADGRCAVNFFCPSEGTPSELFAAETAEDYEKLYYAFSVLPILAKGGAAALVRELVERRIESETIFIATDRLSAAELREMLGGGLSAAKSIRIFLTGGEPERDLALLADAEERVRVRVIDPDEIALSLRNALAE
ncbi:MAG: DUF58 domain-containing protein [Bacteroides sp.]|nr:DUF58 domain-containing protein [Eubacterium sp.]MCM1418043.1 DUF58 domain-containing protein [Roseburia sp.]MCM1462134.1 DUF58 domain-containing protein [Bacteroides sp.]